MSTSSIQKVAAGNAGNWIAEGWETGHPFGDEKASSEKVLSAKRSRHHLGPWGNELNIKVLEFNESREDHMFKVFNMKEVFYKSPAG